MDKIKILEVSIASSGVYGGVQRFLEQYCRRMSESEFAIDFMYINKAPRNNIAFSSFLQERKVFELNQYNTNNKIKKYIRWYIETERILKKGSYDIIHVHSGYIMLQTIMMLVARRNHTKIRIAHSHGMAIGGSKLSRIYRVFLRKIIERNCTHMMACSEPTGKSLFGEEASKKGKITIVKNAIEVQRFRFDENTRLNIRNEMNCGLKTVFITVGALLDVKNHLFAIEVINEIYKINKEIEYWIVGDGQLRDIILNRIRDYKLENTVSLLGQRDDVEKLLQGADAYICTSKTEGMSFSLIEAQTAGLKVFSSDCVPHHHSVTDLVQYYSFCDGAEKWAMNIVSELAGSYDRSVYYLDVIESGFDIEKEARKLENIYRSAIGNG